MACLAVKPWQLSGYAIQWYGSGSLVQRCLQVNDSAGVVHCQLRLKEGRHGLSQLVLSGRHIAALNHRCKLLVAPLKAACDTLKM